MSLEENKAIVRRYQDLLNAGDLDALDTVVATTISMPEALPGFPSGLEGARAIAAANLTMIPDFHIGIEELVAEGDRVVARFTITGTHSRDLYGLAPTGRTFRVLGMAQFRIADGKIVEHYGLGDMFGAFRQLGAFPSLG